jgi:hypothetical protein
MWSAPTRLAFVLAVCATVAILVSAGLSVRTQFKAGTR